MKFVGWVEERNPTKKGHFTMQNKNVGFRKLNPTYKTTSGGFIFLEVMLAITFFSISIIYIFAGFSRSVILTQKSINQFTAMGILEEKINELTIRGNGLNDLNGLSGYRWKMGSLGKKHNLDEITCVVEWEEGKNRGSIEVVTYSRQSSVVSR
ncbi:MAG: hypothetical protein ABII25_05280 [bacterium]